MTAIPEQVVPKDLVEEILCRVPAKNLRRLRSTCKEWNRLLKDDRRFAREQCEKAAKQCIPLMLTKHLRICPMSINLHGDVPCIVLERELSIADPHFGNKCEFDIAEVFHCDGLLVCAHDGTPRYGSKMVVWNPLTGQTRWIQAKGLFFVLGYSQDKRSSRKSYKLMNALRYKKDPEIYDFDSDSWKVVDHDIAPGWSIGYPSYRSVSLKGDIYWFAKNQTISLLRFDFSTETSQRVPLPYQCVRYEAASLTAVGEDKLSVFLQRDLSSKKEIWVTNKIDDTTTNAVSWTKILALDLSWDVQISNCGSFLLDEEKKTVMWCETWIDMEDEAKSIDKIYIVGEDNKVTPVEFGFDIDPSCLPAVLNYAPSFVQIERPPTLGKRKRAD